MFLSLRSASIVEAAEDATATIAPVPAKKKTTLVQDFGHQGSALDSMLSRQGIVPSDARTPETVPYVYGATRTSFSNRTRVSPAPPTWV